MERLTGHLRRFVSVGGTMLSVALVVGCSSGPTGVPPTLAGTFALQKPVVLDSSAAGSIVLVSSTLDLKRDGTWTSRETVTNTEAGSGSPENLVAKGTYTFIAADSTLTLRTSNGTVSSVEVLGGGVSLRMLSGFGRILIYDRVAPNQPI